MAVSAQYLLNGSVGVSVGGTGTAIKYFTDLPPASIWGTNLVGVNASVNSNQQGVTPTTTSNLGGLPVPGRSVMNGQRFNIFASGDIFFAAGDASGAAGGIVLQASSAVAGATPNYVTIGSVTDAQVLDGVTYPWTISAVVQGTTASGIAQVNYTTQFGGAAIVTGVATITGVNFATEPAFVVVCGVTFPTSNAANLANLYELKVVQE